MFQFKKIFEKDWYFRKYISFLSYLFPSAKIDEIRLIHKIKLVYKATFGKSLHLKHPTNLNEKLIWLSLYWRHPLKSICADKVKVRDYVAGKGLAHLLIPVIGIYNTPEEIQYESLPERFVLKCNHGCGYNIIVKEKNSCITTTITKKLNTWLSEVYRGGVSEIHYRDIAPHLIICEEFLGDEAQEWMIDYKIHCINGVPEFVLVCYDRDDNEVAKLATYDLSWHQLFYTVGEKETHFKMPESLPKMIEYAIILSANFPFVRVDYYDINGVPFFGEMTFTPYGNMIDYFKKEVLISLGRKLSLPQKYK